MKKLETIKDVLAITRDLLLIILFVVIAAAGFVVINFVNSIDPSQLSCENLVNTAMTGSMSQITRAGSQNTNADQYTATKEIISLMSETEAAASKGDEATAIKKLNSLRALCQENGYTKAVEKIDELKLAIQQQNYAKALSTASQLKKMFGQ